MPSYKAEAYARILNEAKGAQPIEGKPNVYSPEEYNKVIQGERLMADLGQGGEWITAQTSVGDAEFDKTGRLKAIGRSKPALLPLDVYTANKYKLEIKTEEQKYLKKSKKKSEGSKSTEKTTEEATRTIKITEIIVVMGHALVQAIEQTSELPPTVKVHRFRRTNQGNWNYVGAEFVKSDVCREMTESLDAESMFELMSKMEKSQISTTETGHSLKDIA